MIAVAAGYSWDINDIFRRRLERNRPGLPDERGRPIIVVLHIAATDCVALGQIEPDRVFANVERHSGISPDTCL